MYLEKIGQRYKWPYKDNEVIVEVIDFQSVKCVQIIGKENKSWTLGEIFDKSLSSGWELLEGQEAPK
jgi:hypothetical protein